jgi:hypothetical protein
MIVPGSWKDSVVVLLALWLPVSASSAVTSAGEGLEARSALPSTGAVLTVRFPVGACGSRRTQTFVTVTDRQRRPLKLVRVVVRAGTRIGPVAGVTDATGQADAPDPAGPLSAETTHPRHDRETDRPARGDEAANAARLLSQAHGPSTPDRRGGARLRRPRMCPTCAKRETLRRRRWIGTNSRQCGHLKPRTRPPESGIGVNVFLQ